MNQGTYPLAASMVNQLNRVDVLSNNLANSRTTGFKQDNLTEGSFNYYLDRATQDKFEPTKYGTVTNTIPKIDSKFISSEQGAITPTNNQLDFALKQEDMFFKVKDPKTQDVLLTRDGTFSNLDGKLVTKNGFEVLDVDNNPILMEDGFENQISLVQTSFSNLLKKGNNNYSVKSQEDVVDAPNNETTLLQGALERSNVNSVVTMVNLIDSNRRFEQAQKAITGIDSINKTLIEQVGRAV